MSINVDDDDDDRDYNSVRRASDDRILNLAVQDCDCFTGH